MPEAAVSPLVTWESFCTIIGSAAAALTGLMFVVITVIAGSAGEQVRRSGDGIAAFGTPTVVHFCTALLIAVTLGAPWPALWQPGLLLGLAGLGGVVYIGIIFRRTRHQTDYKPILEDWLWYVVFPLASYTGLVVGAFLLTFYAASALFGIATVTVLFLFIGIHNAWDTVTYIAVVQSRPDNDRQDQ